MTSARYWPAMGQCIVCALASPVSLPCLLLSWSRSNPVKIHALEFRMGRYGIGEWTVPNCQALTCSSLDRSLLHIPTTRTVTGDRAFHAAAPRPWNDLPRNIRKRQLYMNAQNSPFLVFLANIRLCLLFCTFVFYIACFVSVVFIVEHI